MQALFRKVLIAIAMIIVAPPAFADMITDWKRPRRFAGTLPYAMYIFRKWLG
jgi:hypothetical protein